MSKGGKKARAKIERKGEKEKMYVPVMGRREGIGEGERKTRDISGGKIYVH